jgi:hypothetical protein
MECAIAAATAFALDMDSPEGGMRPTVLIIEARREVAAALKAVIEAIDLQAMVVPHLERLSDLEFTPAAIVARIAFEGIGDPPHAAIRRLPGHRPPVVAIAWEEDELAEARTLHCDAIIHAPNESWRLGETLRRLVQAQSSV